MAQHQETRGLKCRPTKRVSRQASTRLAHNLALSSGITKEDGQQSCLLLDKFNLLIGADTTAKNVVIRDAQSRLRVDSSLLPARRTATRIIQTTSTSSASSSFIQEYQHDKLDVLSCLKRQQQQQIRQQSLRTRPESRRSLTSIGRRRRRRGARADLTLIMPSIMAVKMNLLFVMLISTLLLASGGIGRGIWPVSGQLESLLNRQTTNIHIAAPARQAQAPPMQPHQMEMINTNEPLEGEADQQLQFEQPQPDFVAPSGPSGAHHHHHQHDRYLNEESSQRSNQHFSGRALMPQASALVGQQQQQQQQPKALVRTVNPGDRVNIPCSLANMGGSIQFAKDDQPIILDSGCAHCQLDISNDGQASLTINRVGQHDQGHWQCWRLDAQGKVKQKIPIIQLMVTNSPELPILIVNDKELLGGNNLDATITIKENELVTFKCVIRGAATPVDYVHWILDSSNNVTELSQLMVEFSAQENNYLTQSVLKLNATKSMNLKSISCLSNHQLWLTPMTVTALMNVLYEPSFTISREPGFGVPVSEGMMVTLKCEIDSNPSSSPIWIRDADNKTAAAAAANNNNNNANGQQEQQQFNGKESNAEPILLDTQEDGSVVFQPAKQSDSGWYRCKTENKYGNFSSFGYYLNVRPAASSGALPQAQAATTTNHMHQRPRIMGPNQAAAQVAGSSFNSQLTTSRPMTLDSSSMSSGQVNPLQRLQVANDQPQYSSSSTSQHHQPSPLQADSTDLRGCPKQQPRLDGFPEIKSPVSTIQAVLGRQLILPLRFCCNPGPARVFWIHRHLAMIPGRMFGPYITRDVYPTYNSVYCYETTFEIEQVKPEDIGTVYVFVSNEKGHAGAQIHIQLAKQQANSLDGHHYGGVMSGHSSNTLGSRFPLGSPFTSSSATKLATDHWTLMMLVVCIATVLAANLQSPSSPEEIPQLSEEARTRRQEQAIDITEKTQQRQLIKAERLGDR